MSALPGCDLASAFADHNVPETWPRAVNAYTYVSMWALAAATTQESASLVLHYDGIQRNNMLTSLRDVQIQYHPFFNGTGNPNHYSKAFVVLHNRQFIKLIGGRGFETQQDVAANIFRITDEIVAMMQDKAIKSVSSSNRTPLQHLSEFASREVIPIHAFYFDQRPSYDIDGPKDRF